MHTDVVHNEQSMTPHPAGSARHPQAGGCSPRRMTPARRREHLINTALRLYSQQSLEDVSIDDIVTTADVSRALFYRYFTNIRDVHVAALSTVVDELIGRLTLPPDDDFRQQLHHTLAEFVTFVETYATSYTALLRSGSTIATSTTDTLVDRVRDHVVDLFRERLGHSSSSPMLERTLRGWIAVVETTLLSWLQHTDLPREQLETWLTDQLLAMITTTAQHDPTAAEQIRHLLAESGDEP